MSTDEKWKFCFEDFVNCCAEIVGVTAVVDAANAKLAEWVEELSEENTRLRDFVRRVAEFEKQIAASVCPTRPNTRMGEEAEKLLEKK